MNFAFYDPISPVPCEFIKTDVDCSSNPNTVLWINRGIIKTIELWLWNAPKWICKICPRSPKICVLFHAEGNPWAPGAKFANLFHSDFPMGSIYRPVLKFLKNIKKCGLQMIKREKCLRKKNRIWGFPEIEKFWKFEIFQNRQKSA